MSAIYLILYYAPTAVLLAIGVQFELTGPSTVLIYGISVPLIYLVLLERIIWNGFVAKVSVKEEFKEFQQNINNSVSLHGQMRLISRLLDKKSTDEAINCFSETFVGTGHLSTDDFSSIVKKSKEYENQFGENTGIHYLLNHIRKFNVDNKAILNALMRCSS
jgi:hypothetical protein